MFTILKKDLYSKARLGVLTTPHGVVKTPAYVIVATYGHIRYLSPADIKKTKTQILICNTYHLWDKVKLHGLTAMASRDTGFRGAESSLQKAHSSPALRQGLSGAVTKNNSNVVPKLLGLKIPAMTDSGGFQVFSLAFGDNSDAKKIFPTEMSPAKQLKRKNVKITNKGVYFNPVRSSLAKVPKGTHAKGMSETSNGTKFLSPEISMQIQSKLGADIIFAFDECTSFFDDFKYNKKAMERTHRWALKCLMTNDKQQTTNDKKQMLFGIVQGGRYKQLRIQSAKFIGSLPFDGFGIGGSFGKEEMAKMLKWVIPRLPEEKPRHLLGVGKIDDIFRAVENGIDLFDCVIPTREARHGRLHTKTGHIDIRRGAYLNDTKIIEPGCKCPTCSKKIPRSKIRELIKSSDKKENAAGQRWCLLHNIWFFNNFVEQIRESIEKNKYKEFKKKFLKNWIG